jgi:hypothetical protein
MSRVERNLALQWLWWLASRKSCEDCPLWGAVILTKSVKATCEGGLKVCDVIYDVNGLFMTRFRIINQFGGQVLFLSGTPLQSIAGASFKACVRM